MISIRRRPAALAAGIALAIGLMASSASAQEARMYEIGGGFLGGSSLEAGAVYSDNYFYEATNSLSATGYRVRPEVRLSRNMAPVEFRLNSYAEQADYDLPGDLDNYTDYGADSGLVWRPFSRHAFDVSGVYRRGHDQSGLLRTETTPVFDVGEIDEWNQTEAYVAYQYGAPGSTAGNRLRAGQRSREYVTNRDATVFLNYDVRELGYELDYRYSPKTAFLLDVGHRSINYERGVLSSIGNRNGNEFTLRTGLRWQATAKTSGDLRIGASSYSLDGRARDSRQSLSWRANVRWEATNNTQIQLATGQSNIETFRNDTFFIEERNVGLSWRQVWTPRLNTTLGAAYSQSEFVGSTREDDVLVLSAGFGYTVLRNVSLFGDYGRNDRGSNEAFRDYDVGTARLGLRWTP